MTQQDESDIGIQGDRKFVYETSIEVNKAIDENPELARVPIRSKQTNWFNGWSKVSIEKDDEEESSHVLFRGDILTKANIVWGFECLRKQAAFLDEKFSTINALHAEVDSLSKNDLADIAEPVKQKIESYLQHITKCFVYGAAFKDFAENYKPATEVEEKIRASLNYKLVSSISNVEEKKFILADNVALIAETADLDSLLGGGTARQFLDTLATVSACFKNPTQTLLKNAARKVYENASGRTLNSTVKTSVIYA